MSIKLHLIDFGNGWGCFMMKEVRGCFWSYFFNEFFCRVIEICGFQGMLVVRILLDRAKLLSSNRSSEVSEFLEQIVPFGFEDAGFVLDAREEGIEQFVHLIAIFVLPCCQPQLVDNCWPNYIDLFIFDVWILHRP